MIEKKKEKYKNMAVQMDNVRGLLGIRRMDRLPNTQIKKLCRVKNGWTKGLMKVFSSDSAT